MDNKDQVADLINAELAKIYGFENWGNPLLNYGVSLFDLDYVLSLIEYFHLENKKVSLVPGRIDSIEDVIAHFEIVRCENKASEAIDNVLYKCEEEANVISMAEEAKLCLGRYIDYLIDFHQYQKKAEYVAILKEAREKLEEWKDELIDTAKNKKQENMFKYHNDSVFYSLSEKLNYLEIDYLYVIGQMEEFIVTTIAHSLGFNDFNYSDYK